MYNRKSVKQSLGHKSRKLSKNVKNVGKGKKKTMKGVQKFQ